MKKSIALVFLTFFSANAFADYGIDFFIGESKNTRPLKYHLKIKNIDVKNEDIESIKPTVDEFGDFLEPVYNQIGNEISPGENFHFRLSNNTTGLIKDNLKVEPSSIVFTVLDETKKELGEVNLSWLYNGEKINFISDEKSSFVFLPFQRNMPIKDRKTGLLKYTYEISIIDIEK